MRRAWMAVREWLELRARVREEWRFHMDQSAADFRALGLPRRAAMNAARVRFGARRNARMALQEIGGDWAGLAGLFRAHRVAASVWLQPSLLLASIAAALLLSPAPQVLVESVIGGPLRPESPRIVYLSAPAPWPLFTGITPRELESLRSMSSLTALERYQAIYVRGVARNKGLAAVEAESRARTGNARIHVISQFEETRVGTGPAIAASIPVAFLFLSFLCTNLPHIGKVRWMVYGLLVACLHLLASLTVWTLAVQIWSKLPWPRYLPPDFILAVLLVAFLLMAATQYLWWRLDLSQRCPICLERLLLASTDGTSERVLLSVAVTESVCAHGHGVRVETRWARHFRREDSPLDTLIHA